MPRLRHAVLVAMLVLGIVAAAGAPASAALPAAPDDTWGTNGKVDAVLRVGSTIYLAGAFSQLVDPDTDATQTVSDLAGIDATTGRPTGFAPAMNGEVFALAPSPDGTRLYAAGNFTTVNGNSVKRIVAFDTATGAVTGWKPFGSPNNVVRALAVTSDRLYIGGAFTSLGSTPATRIAALSTADGSPVPGFAASADNLVRDLVLAPGRLYVAGNFTVVNGTTQGKLTALDPNSGASIPGVYHPSYPVLDLAAGARLYGAGGGGGGKAFAVDLATGAKLWEKKTDGNVQGVDVLNDTPYFGGHFLKYDGVAVNQLVRANAATGALDTSWLPDVTAGFLGVFGIDGYGTNRLYVGGDFTRVEGLRRLNFAQFTDGAAPTSADLGVTLAGAPATVAVGQPVTFTAQVTNAGPDSAVGATLTDPLPAGLDFVSAPGCSYDDTARTVTCPLGAVDTRGASAAITALATSAGAIANPASVGAATADANPSNNAASATTTVTSAGGADLGVTTTVPAKLDQRTGFAYVLTVTNHGPNPEPAATLVDALPANAAPAGPASTTAGTCSGTGTVTCSLGALGSGDAAVVTVPMTAPATPQTLLNAATVDGTQFDPVPTNDASLTFASVRDPAAAGDTTAPARTGMTMLDTDHDGFVDTVSVTFSEPLAACAAPCTGGWALTGVPSGGSLQSVSVSGSTATLALGGWTDQPDTSVGLFTVALGTGNGIQDAAGNHPAFAAAAPADGAGPVPVGFRHQHSTSGACAGSANTAGVPEACDELTAEWSEQLAPGSIPATTPVAIADPAGSGPDVLAAPGFLAGPTGLGSDGYVTADGATATWASSLLSLSTARDALTLRLFGACTGDGCTALGSVKVVSVTFTPSPSITDAAGNPAAGSFTKSQTMF